jgi:phosphate-selective porin OprO/OprP
LPTYVSVGQAAFFTYNSNAYADGVQTRISPQAYWYSGNKGLLAEYAISNQNVTSGATHKELQNKAWNIVANYVLTGEDSNYSGGVKPANAFNFANNAWGAFEVIGRFTYLEIDNDAFPVLASSSSSAKKADTYGAGLNWYLNENLKVDTNYNYTSFDGGAAGGKDRPEEHVVQSRIQVRF